LASIEQFNTKQFYACHDTLEALWIDSIEPEKSFYQGILQIAVALYHLGNQNLRGAMILIGEGSNRLRRYPSVFGGIDVDELLSQSIALLEELQQTSPEEITAINLETNPIFALPVIILVQEENL
jgi:predicted metal-dependent hydrolase